MRGTVRRGEGEKGGRREAKEEKRERQICRMTTMTMTRRSRRFHFLYRDRDVRELQKKKDLAERDESAVKKRGKGVETEKGGREADGTLRGSSVRI